MKMRQIASGIALVLAVTSVAQASGDGKNHKKPKPPVNVKIVAINDFHGQLESPGSLRNVPATSTLPNPPATPVGGVDWIAGYIADLRNKNPYTTLVSAGDLIGAAPLISALFHDEGTIETMNRAGLDINAVGNHEFDEGKDELLRMQKGGCHPVDENSCQGARVGTPVPFEGARWRTRQRCPGSLLYS